MRSLLFFLSVLILTGISACSPEDPFIPSKSPDTLAHPAYLRVIQAAEEASNVTVLVGTSSFFSAPIQYMYSDANNTFEYYRADTSAKSISFLTSGSMLASSPLSLAEGQYYTAYLYGTTGAYHVLITKDTVQPAPDASTSIVRVVHLSPDSPTLTVHFGADPLHGPPTIASLPYGTASSYFTRPAGGTGMALQEAATGNTLISVPSPYAYFPGQAIVTLIMTGRSHPTGNQRLITLNATQESTPNSNGSFGGPNFPLALAALRFANLIPTYPNGVGTEATLDIAIRDPLAKDWAVNDYFRRNLNNNGMASLLDVPPLGYNTSIGLQPIHHHFLAFLTYLSTLTFRVEINSGPNSSGASRQDTIVARRDLIPVAGMRYTLVAYGPFKKDSAQSAVVIDNAQAPPSSALMTVRFFNGAFDLPAAKLRIRIGTATSPAMPYGKPPDGATESFTAPAGSVIDLLDESGQVIYNYTVPDGIMKGGGIYTVYLSRGAYGTAYTLTPVDDSFSL